MLLIPMLLSNQNACTRACAPTVEYLLNSFVAHLCSCEALQRHQRGVCSVAQQEPAGLEVARQRRAVQRRLTQRVQGVHLRSQTPQLLQSDCTQRVCSRLM